LCGSNYRVLRARDGGGGVGVEDDEFLDIMVTLPYDHHVAERWGHIQAAAQLRGRPRPVNDSWVAARCLIRDLPLIAFNIKDYTDLADHEASPSRSDTLHTSSVSPKGRIGVLVAPGRSQRLRDCQPRGRPLTSAARSRRTIAQVADVRASSHTGYAGDRTCRYPMP
jgi:hypothetical protein